MTSDFSSQNFSVENNYFFWYLLSSYILGFSELCFGEFLFITWTTIMFNAGTFENVAELFDIE